MTPSWRWQHIGVFLVLLVIFTAIGESLAIISGDVFGAKGYYVQLIMWSPAAAATLTAFIAKTPLKVFGWNWLRIVYIQKYCRGPWRQDMGSKQFK